MTIEMFNRACDMLLGEEAGYVNDPNDPGGETKWGVSKRSYPNLDIKNLTREDAKTKVYKPDFWDYLELDSFPPRLAFLVFDSAVNESPFMAVYILQRALGVFADGRLGPITKGAMRIATSTAQRLSDLCTEFVARRIVEETKLSIWKVYDLGWSRRLAAQPLRALAMEAPDGRVP